MSNPVPVEAAMPREDIDAITTQALTGGRSLATTIALAKHNAAAGARLARALAA